jgi:16S rRNA U516 pseudouridylate synthase RsuA-like enzyme
MNTALKSVLEDQFLHKYISVPVVERDQWANEIDNRFVNCTGKCLYIGTIPVFSAEDLYVVIDGMPVRVRHMNDIVLINKPKDRVRYSQTI